MPSTLEAPERLFTQKNYGISSLTSSEGGRWDFTAICVCVCVTTYAHVHPRMLV